MTEFAADAGQCSRVDTTKAWLRHFRFTAVLGAAGVVVAATTGQDGASDSAVTLAKDGGTTGQYLLTFPKSPGYVSVTASIYSPAQTIGQMAIVARSYTSAGTASLMFSTKAGVNAYGASGDEIVLDIWAETRPRT